MRIATPALAAATLAITLLAGCRVSEKDNGPNKNVSIGTPFGSMNVKTNDNAENAAIGIDVYPGATPYKESDDKNASSADVNLSFGDFHIGVKAASYLTPDSQDKVLTFYRKDLGRYGTVIECRGNQTVGEPARTTQGLACSDNADGQAHGSIDMSHDDLELRTGSEQHQHIVGIEQKDGGTRIGIVALDLPSSLVKHGKGDVE